MRVTKAHLDQVAARYAAAWESQLAASGRITVEYPFEVNVAHYLASALASDAGASPEPLPEAVRDRVRNVDLKQVNRVLMQPHWRREQDIL